MAKTRMLGRMGRNYTSSPSAAADDTDASAYLFLRSVSETAKAEAIAISNTSNADDPSPLSSSKPSKLMDEKHKLLQQKRPKNTKTRRQKLNTVVGRGVLPKLKKNLAGIITSTRTSSSNPSSMPTSSASSSLPPSSGDVDTSLSTQESSDSAVSGAAAADIILLFDHSDEVGVDDQSFATSGTTGDVTTATGATAQVGNLTNDPGMNVLSAILDVSSVNMSWDDRHGSDDNSCDDDDDDDDDLIIIAGSAVTIDYVYQTSSPTRLPSPTGSTFVPRTANANRERNLNQRQPPTEGGILDRFFDRFSCGGGCGAYSSYDM